MAEKINKNEITKDMLEKAMQCKTADELMELAKTEGFEITKDEAEAYMTELTDFDLENEELKKVAGGDPYCFYLCDKDCNACDHNCVTVA